MRDQVNDDFGVAGGLEDRAALDQIGAQRHRVGQVAVMRDGKPAEIHIGIKRLDVADARLARRRIAVMADSGMAGQKIDDGRIAERAVNKAKRLFAVKMLAVETDDAAGFLASVLQGMQPERRKRRRVVMAVHAKDAAFVVELVVTG